MTTPSSIPQSDALQEASQETLSDLLSRDPESYSKSDITKIVSELVSASKKWLQQDLSGEAKPKRKSAPKALEISNVLSTTELDF